MDTGSVRSGELGANEGLSNRIDNNTICFGFSCFNIENTTIHADKHLVSSERFSEEIKMEKKHLITI